MGKPVGQRSKFASVKTSARILARWDEVLGGPVLFLERQMDHWKKVQQSEAFKELIRREEQDRKKFDQIIEQSHKYYCEYGSCGSGKRPGKKFCAKHAKFEDSE